MNPRDLSLMRAVTDGDTETVRALLASGLEVNGAASGAQTPLILAILFRRTQILSLLLEAGADPQLRDSLGLNAVDWAERKGFSEGLTLLTKNQTARGQTPSAIQPENSSLPAKSVSKIEQQNSQVSLGSTQSSRSHERSRRWLAGLKRRFDEEARHKRKTSQQPASDGLETRVEKEPSVPTTTDTEVMSLTPDRTDILLTETSPPTEEGHPPKATTADIPADYFLPHPDTTTFVPLAPSPSRKRCPKCNAVYASDLLAYCAVDVTPLVGADEPIVPYESETNRTWLVWLLVGLTFLAALGVTYLLFRKQENMQKAPLGTLGTPAAGFRTMPIVAGELSGKQLDLPQPDYPESAKRAHVSGTVTISVRVDKEGKVIAVKVMDGDPRLRNAAIAAARKTTFSAEKLLGQEAQGTIVYTFR